MGSSALLDNIGPDVEQPDAEQLEETYHRMVAEGEEARFVTTIDNAYAAQPDNLLYAAWHYRLAHALVDSVDAWRIRWAWAVPLALLNALTLWLLLDDSRFLLELGAPVYTSIPLALLLYGPISAGMLLIYLTAAGQQGWRGLITWIVLLTGICAYVLLFYAHAGPIVFQDQYLMLMVLHLPVMAWAAVGFLSLSNYGGTAQRFAFLSKSLEVFVMAGLFVIAGVAFVVIGVALFAALGIELSDWAMRVFIAAAGLVPILAAAIIYNPTVTPAEQPFGAGLSRLIALLMRVMLPLTLLFSVVYVAFIPLNWQAPFENREALITYNAMLFGVLLLLLGATPTRRGHEASSADAWLRRGLTVLAAIALLVSVYALAAILFRAWQDRLTPNRLTFIGWNVVNMTILLLILGGQLMRRQRSWLAAMQRAFAAGALLYVGWTLVVIVALPWLFGIRQGNVAQLPPTVQALVYERADPILLKCGASPHIYLLEGGSKRWIRDVPTFNAEGFAWSDVAMVSCETLRAVPNGEPIPPDAGEPPQP